MARNVTVIPAKQTGKSNTTDAKKKLRVACYCRVSTDHEEQEGSFRNQVEYYTSFINSRADWVMAGVFTDDGISGTGTKKRKGFMELIKACEDGMVDFVITKSVSRFARNTADSLFYSRKLKNMGIPILFEKENVNTMDASGELMFTILSSLAQEESRNISENTQWGIRSKFQQGIPQINCECLLGYDKDKNGNLVINEEQAKVVRRVFRDFLEGWSLSEICRKLNAEEVPGVHGKARWAWVSVQRILTNEKHVGDILMQKTYTSDFLTKTGRKNHGELEQYYIRDNHEPIVSRELWDAAQMELERREQFRKNHGIRRVSSTIFDRFCCKVFCAHCGGKYIRVNYKGIKAPFWKCENKQKKKGHTCSAENVYEADLKEAVVTAWNRLVEARAELLPKWEKMVTEGNALECYRARHMIAVTADGEIEIEIPELTRMFLEEISVESPTELTVKFLDGSEVNVKI